MRVVFVDFDDNWDSLDDSSLCFEISFSVIFLFALSYADLQRTALFFIALKIIKLLVFN